MLHYTILHCTILYCTLYQYIKILSFHANKIYTKSGEKSSLLHSSLISNSFIVWFCFVLFYLFFNNVSFRKWCFNVLNEKIEIRPCHWCYDGLEGEGKRNRNRKRRARFPGDEFEWFIRIQCWGVFDGIRYLL